MEEKTLDKNSIIGFILIALIMGAWLYLNQPTEEEIAAQKEKQKQEQLAQEKEETKEVVAPVVRQELPKVNAADSTSLAQYQSKVGHFGATAVQEGTTTLENNLLLLEVDNRGGQIVKAHLKEFVDHDSVPIYMIKDGNANFDLQFSTSDNRVLNSSELYFEPEFKEQNGSQTLTLRAKAGPGQFLEYQYTMKPDQYLVDFVVRSQNLRDVINNAKPVTLDWKLKGIRHDKSIRYENRYSRLTYMHDGGRVSKLSDSSDEDDDQEEEVQWISYRQHFFSSILASSTPFASAELLSRNLVEDEDKTQKFTKDYESKVPLQLQGGELAQSMHWYFGPTDVQVLKQYKDLELVESMPFGWGIFGWINRYIFNPFYTWLSSFLPYGIAIIIMTIMVRLFLSPVTYKSYLSQAKMKVLKPEITELNEKYADNAMKKQQETMKLYNKAGVSPMSGCVPALLQLPIFYALFMFFPTSFALRQKSFLWAEDLSSYDTIAELPFSIPFYGDHVSLFPILASVAIFFYMRMTTGQSMQMQQQPGMPNMKFIMYLSPVMMLFFFNNYASGLSLYYFISNLITIFIMLVIKNYIIDEQKIHLQIEANKKKPKKENKFQKRMRELMEEAEAQKKGGQPQISLKGKKPSTKGGPKK